jgi:poly-gamma-glutamate synthesis protein (capsule biosynthesis protein)
MVPLHMKLFLCGDVMTGRGIDQILPAPCDPELDEPWVKSALDYVRLAEYASAAIPRRASPSTSGATRSPSSSVRSRTPAS